MGLMDKIFGTHSQHELKRIYPIVDRIEALEPEMKALSDAELKDKTREFKERLKEGETLDDILPEAYAVVREGAYRSMGMRHYRVQLIGGIILHQGRIAEMRTGEGKTRDRYYQRYGCAAYRYQLSLRKIRDRDGGEDQ